MCRCFFSSRLKSNDDDDDDDDDDSCNRTRFPQSFSSIIEY